MLLHEYLPRMKSLLLLGIASAVLLNGGVRASDSVEEVKARAAIAQRLTKTSNLECSYDSSVTSTPSPQMKKVYDQLAQDMQKNGAPGRLVFPFGTTQITGRLLVLQDNLLSQVSLAKESEDDAKARKWVATQPEDWVITPDRTEHLSRPIGASPIGIISGKADIPLYWSLDIALGLRAYGQNSFLTKQEWDDATVRSGADGWIIVESELPGGMKNQWIFDPKRAFVLIKYTFFGPEGEGPRVQVDCTDFKEDHGVLLPYKIVMRIYDHAGPKPVVTTEVSTSIKSYSIGDIKNTKERYRMVWPAGCSVLDKRSNRQHDVGGAPRSFTDDELFRDTQGGA